MMANPYLPLPESTQSRTFKEEYNLYKSWSDEQPRHGGGSHAILPRSLFFAYSQGWIPDQVLWLHALLIFELLALILVTYFLSGIWPLLAVFVIIGFTQWYLCLFLWRCSKLVFVTTAPIALLFTGLALLLATGVL
jgi:hypothetical protein